MERMIFSEIKEPTNFSLKKMEPLKKAFYL